ncbi:GntR family transcriptional regulator [Haloimpatiens lingqiaonensis]|uniref:GntR family transcriptional regulator n=1 Tax=Haloimpatiens lingqiaonensis TaxID=1380675 RepID=UPI0014858152|nr:GntR family transcriptional regulator [Haloimpatiens lingqiaonensis]
MKNSNLKQNLREKVYENIRDRILSGFYKPSEILLETTIAKEFEVSRTPVREAMTMLCQDNLLEAIPKNGYMIKTITHVDILEMYFIRILLEGAAAELAAVKITKEQIKKLENLVKYPDCDCIWEYNKKFHTIIAEASGNKKLIELIDKLLDEGRRIVMIDPYMHLLKDTAVEDHIALIEALKNKDGKKAKTIMETHLTNARERIHNSII